MASKIVFAGLARDCAGWLPGVLANLERYAALADEAAFVFIENDSRDTTRASLEKWLAGRPNSILFDLTGLGQMPIRTLRLEFARNVYLEYVRNHESLRDADWLCVLDMDNVNALPADPAQFQAALNFLEADPLRAGVFANQQGIYYDMWALRAQGWCPGDVWLEVMDCAERDGISDQAAFDKTFATRIRELHVDSPAIAVESAFGGLGLYRMDFVRRNPNPYLGWKVHVRPLPVGVPRIFRMQYCEHVHFNAGIRALGGSLHIVPSWVNGNTPRVSSFPPSAYRGMLF